MAATADAIITNDMPMTTTAPSTCSEPVDPCCSTSGRHSPARSLPIQTVDAIDDRAKSVPLCDIKNDPCSSAVEVKPAMSLHTKQLPNRTLDIKPEIKTNPPMTAPTSRLVKAAPQRCSLTLPDDCAKKLAALAIRHPKILAHLGITKIGTDRSTIDLISRASRDYDDHWFRMQTPTTSRDTQLLQASNHHIQNSMAIINPTTDMMPRPGSDESRVESGLGSSRASSDNNQSQTSQADSGMGNGRSMGIKSPPSRAMSASNFRPPQPTQAMTPQWSQPAGRKPGSVAGAPVHHMQQMVQAQQSQEQAQQPSLLVGLLRSSQNPHASYVQQSIRIDAPPTGDAPTAKKRKKKEPSATARKKAKQDIEKELLAQSMGQAPAMTEMPPAYLQHPYYQRAPRHPSVADPATSHQYQQKQYQRPIRPPMYEQKPLLYQQIPPGYPAVASPQRMQQPMTPQHKTPATPPAACMQFIRRETETPGTPMSGHEVSMDSPASAGHPTSQFPQSPAEHANVVLSPRTERQITDSIDSVLAMPEPPPGHNCPQKMTPQYHAQQQRMPPPQFAAPSQSQQQSQYPGAYPYAQAAPQHQQQYRATYYTQTQYAHQHPTQQYPVASAANYSQQYYQHTQQQYYGAQSQQYQYPGQEHQQYQYQHQYQAEQQQQYQQYAQQRPMDSNNYVVQQ